MQHEMYLAPSLPSLLELSVLIWWHPAIAVALAIGGVKAGLGKRDTESSLNPDPGAEHFPKACGD